MNPTIYLAITLDQRRPASYEPQPPLYGRDCHRGFYLPGSIIRPSWAQTLLLLWQERPSPNFRGLTEDWQEEPDESPDGSFPCLHWGAPVPEMGMANFSFNKPAD
jgi:hypothetical protein